MSMANVYSYRAPSCGNAELLYLLTDGIHVKIGRTSGKICHRVSALQTGSPRRIKPVVSVEIPGGAAEAEAYCHRILRPFNTNGEWFKCSIDESFRALIVSAAPYLGSCWVVHEKRLQDKFFKAVAWHERNWRGLAEATDGTRAG